MLLVVTVIAQPGNVWQETGPHRFPFNESGQVNGIGRISQLKFHATNPAKIYAVSSSGGVWVSTDTAGSWANVGTDQLPHTACSAVCVDYLNDNTIYLGTGDANYYSTSLGVWKTTNGGLTWAQSSTGMGNRLVVELLMDPSNNQVLVAATDNGIYKTSNGGSTWTVVKSGGDFRDMQRQAGSASTLFAVTASQFWRSTDFGSTWTQITNGVVIPGGGSGNGMRIALTAADPNRVYLGMIKDEGTILTSIDGGLSFTQTYHNPAQSLVGYDAAGGGQGDYNFSMTADPNNANTLFVVAHVVWRSTDAGVTWSKLTDWWDQVHTDMHQIKFHPLVTNLLFNANDGGVWVSGDNGDSWMVKSNGLAATEIYHASQSPIRRDMVSIGTQDNGELYHAGNSWMTNRGGDWTSRSAFSYLGGSTVYYYENGKRRVVNGTEASFNLPFSLSGGLELAFNRKMTDLCFSGGMDVWRSLDLGNAAPSWTKISAFNQRVKALHSSVADSNLLYVVTSASKIYRCDNALAASPSFTSYATPASTALFTSVAAIRNNPNVVYISCGNTIYRSANKGATWTNVTANLPAINIIRIYHDEFSTNEAMYVCTAKAVYYKDASMSNWNNISYNLPTVADIQDFMMYNPGNASSLIRVAYYGRGVWELPINTSYPPLPEFEANKQNPCMGQAVTFSDLSYGSPTSWTWSFPGGSPSSSNLQNPTITYTATGQYNVGLTVTNANGTSSVTKSAYISVAPATALPLSEGFVSTITPPGWENYDDANDGVTWALSTSAGGFGTSGSCAYFDNFNNSVGSKRDELRTAEYDLSTSAHPILIFDRAYARYGASNSDSLAILASKDCGLTYQVIYLKGGVSLATAPDMTGSIFTPGASEWKTDTVDLSGYAGYSNVRIAFQNKGQYGQAIYIDNLNIPGVVANGFEEITANGQMRVYPNPGSDQIMLEFKPTSEKDGYQLELVNSLGQVVYSEAVAPGHGFQKQIDVSRFARGLYHLTLSTVQSRRSIKLALE